MVDGRNLLAAYAAVASPIEGGARVVIVRDTGILGGGVPMKVLVDGQGVARLHPGERVELYLPLGDHILGMVPDPQFTAALQEASFSFREPKTYYFRISFSPTSGGGQLSPTTQVQ